MNNAHRLLFAIRAFMLLLLASFCLTSCADNSIIQRPPFEVPFDAGRIGGKADIEVNIVEKRTYSLGIRFFIKNTLEEAARVGKILGASYKDDSGKWVEPGVPATFRVRIYTQPGNQVLLNELVEHPKTRPGYTGRLADLVEISLEPGYYTLSIEYVMGAPELATLPAKISFAQAHHGK